MWVDKTLLSYRDAFDTMPLLSERTAFAATRKRWIHQEGSYGEAIIGCLKNYY